MGFARALPILRTGVFGTLRRAVGDGAKTLLPHTRKRECQKPQHTADQPHHRVGLRKHTGLDEDLARDGDADRGEQQAGAADDNRQIAYRGCDRPGG